MLSSLFFCITSLGFGYVGIYLYSMSNTSVYEDTVSLTYMSLSVLDTFFHMTGDVYSITQHALAPFIVYALNYMSLQTYKTHKILGATSFSITTIGLSLAFMDGAPGITPGYDIFKHPSFLDKNYTMSHICAHTTVLLVPFIYMYAKAKQTKTN